MFSRLSSENPDKKRLIVPRLSSEKPDKKRPSPPRARAAAQLHKGNTRKKYMTEKTLILICIALLLLCILLLFALLLKKNKETEKKNDGSMEALKEKIDKLGGVADLSLIHI